MSLISLVAPHSPCRRAPQPANRGTEAYALTDRFLALPNPHAGVRSNLPTEEPGVTQRVVYSWTVRLQVRAGCT